MTKIIVHSDNIVDPCETLEYVQNVIAMGLISNTANGPQYCFVTEFAGGITVYARKNKNGTHTFHVQADLEKGKK